MLKLFNRQKSNQRRKSELPPVPKNIQKIILNDEDSDEFIGPATSSPRRHSLPACITDKTLIDHLREQALYTIDENENMSIKSPNMNVSPTIKERRPFQFFRSRTLSSSSTGSNEGSGVAISGSNSNMQPTTSPRMSIFDRVRKRSQSDVKSPNTVDQVNGNQNNFQHNLQKHLQDQLFKEQQSQKLKLTDELSPALSPRPNTNVQVANKPRNHLNLSISEERDNDDEDENNNRKIPVFKNNASDRLDSSHGYINSMENNQIFSYFMRHKFCYDIMPKSAKVVVFDTQLLVKKAFFALIYNGVRSAPLWDSSKQKFIGMLTITDFILILQKYYREANAKIEELEDHKLATWREVLKEYSRPFIYLTPEDTLYDAIKVLCTNKVHRLPIIDPVTGNVVCIVTHKRILRYLYLFIYDMPQPDFLLKSLEELKLGTYENIRTIEKNTTLNQAINIFVESRVSALPVIDENKKLVNIYSKFDVIDLAANKTYNNLDVTVTEALQYRSDRFGGVCCCTKDETLGLLMERIVKKEVHRLVIVDEENCVIGIISLSDILTYIVLKQETQIKNTSSMTAAFGMTRLSNSIDHVNMNKNGNGVDQNSGSSSIDNLIESNGSSAMSSANSSPVATCATIVQPQSSTVDQAIFEDDPMEISDSVK